MMLRQWLGSVVFTSILFVTVAVYGLIVILLRVFGYPATYAGARHWARAMLALLRALCGLDYSVDGLENLPQENAVVLMKHSSSWETIAQILIFPRQCWVLKRELIWAPILGWALSLLKPISIDRKSGRAAVEQMIRLGKQRIDEGLWVVVFPEGTRVPVGETRRFGLGGTLLAQAAGRPVIPVAHNAGYFWPRRSLLKRPGTIHVVIGEPIEIADRDPRKINTEIQEWMQREIEAMPNPTA